MISSTSLRLPQKTCGLFDTGSAGDAFDVASFGLSIPADIDQSLFTFEEVSSSSKALSDGTFGVSTAAAVDQNALIKHEMPSETGDLDWDLDFMDPLGGLDDPLGDENLDAFVNLDSFLMEDTFLDNESQIKAEEPAEVTPVIDFFTNPVVLEPVSAVPTTIFDTFKDEDFFLVPSTSSTNKSAAPKSSRKRKAPTSKASPETALLKTQKLTGMTGNSQIDHDYVGKSQEKLSAFEVPHKSNGIKGKRNVRISSTASEDSDVSSTSSVIDVTEFNTLDKQTVRRIKNNYASKKSREQRKQKLSDLDVEADELIVENDRLRNKIVELEKLAKEMKALLVAKMAGKA